MTQAITILIAISALAFMCSAALLVISFISKFIQFILKQDTQKSQRNIVQSAIVAGGSLVLVLICVIAGPIIDPIGWCKHEYSVVEQQDASCTNSGYTKKICSLCNNELVETISASHLWIEDGEIAASCTNPKQIKKKCSLCQTIVYESIGNTLNHSWVEESIVAATCTNSEQHINKCSVCNTMQTIFVGSPLPHSFGKWSVVVKPTTESEGQESRSCSVCNHTENQTILKISPITIISQSYDIDFLGGVSLTRKIKNNTNRTIKYITMEWQCYNAVDDIIYDEITRKSKQSGRWTGPFNAGAIHNLLADGFYNSTFSDAKLINIQVEFMDGEIINITSNEYSNIIQ